jgi:hypothetical protein
MIYYKKWKLQNSNQLEKEIFKERVKSFKILENESHLVSERKIIFKNS